LLRSGQYSVAVATGLVFNRRQQVSRAGELTLNAFQAGLPVARWYI
jgi:hypothetical protein